ncbi:hypothetical protein WMF28_00970 [Sorangium sp. So ce590]|uniref:hypothetical protein n=1 Tax=Sorangium sp. So ce590 TaxID=3133317 RepID=UPI003F5D68D9
MLPSSAQFRKTYDEAHAANTRACLFHGFGSAALVVGGAADTAGALDPSAFKPHPGRRSPSRWFGAVLALAFVLGSAAAVLRWGPPRHAVPRLGPGIQAAADRATPPPSARPLDRCPVPLPGATTPPVATRPRTTRPAAPTRQTMKTPAQEPDLCDCLLPCQRAFY